MPSNGVGVESSVERNPFRFCDLFAGKLKVQSHQWNNLRSKENEESHKSFYIYLFLFLGVHIISTQSSQQNRAERNIIIWERVFKKSPLFVFPFPPLVCIHGIGIVLFYYQVQVLLFYYYFLLFSFFFENIFVLFVIYLLILRERLKKMECWTIQTQLSSLLCCPSCSCYSPLFICVSLEVEIWNMLSKIRI